MRNLFQAFCASFRWNRCVITHGDPDVSDDSSRKCGETSDRLLPAHWTRSTSQTVFAKLCERFVFRRAGSDCERGSSCQKREEQIEEGNLESRSSQEYFDAYLIKESRLEGSRIEPLCLKQQIIISPVYPLNISDASHQVNLSFEQSSFHHSYGEHIRYKNKMGQLNCPVVCRSS